MRLKTAFTLLSLTLLSQTALANENIIGGSIGYGTQDFNLKYDANDGDTVAFDIYYRHMLSDYMGVEAGYTRSYDGIFSDFTSLLSSADVSSYGGPRLSLYGQYPLSHGNALYAKVGVAYHDVDYKMNNVKHNESKVGADLQVGWEKRFHNGMGINVGYQFADSSILTMNNFYVGTSYRF
ncbi:porin family protein [Photobacterium leiognathi]|uniref:porin family protein n=1 Tax=Photobacterium leiognathi TaxID=553611 RepID=UPI002980C3CA|nr:porin family protein [Photobacterium leiognathi]